jgi:hypothetical protein
MARPSLPSSRSAALVVAFALGLAGCGHPATRAECDLILDKIVELELRGQSITDPAVVAQRKVDTRKAKGDEVRQKCEGRKVTDAAMACVQAATSYEQIENQCLR